MRFGALAVGLWNFIVQPENGGVNLRFRAGR